MKLFSSHGIHQRDIRRKSAAALLLSTCLLLPYLADIATAAKLNEICPNHPEHDAECGYTEYVVEQPCMHEHEGSCYTLHVHTDSCYAEIAADEVSDTLDEPPVTQANDTMNEMPETLNPDEESVEMPDTPFETLPAEDGFFDASGEEQRIPDTPAEIPDNIPQAPRKTLVCGLEEGAEVLCCPHEGGEHTEACGYAPAVEASPCTHSCQECAGDAEIPLLADEPIEVSDEAGLRDALSSAASANIILTDSFMVSVDTAADTIQISKQACLDLNGQTLEFWANPNNSPALFSVTGNGNFTIRDSVETCEEISDVTGQEDLSASYSAKRLTYYVNLKVDDEAGGSSMKTYRHIIAAAGSIEAVKKGDISSKSDAIVNVNGGKFQLEGGMLANTNGVHCILILNKPSSGPAFNMTGGYITGADCQADRGNGGGILAGSKSGSITISGGIIAGNKAILGGGIHYGSTESDTTLTISGNTVIAGNGASAAGGGINVVNPEKLSIVDNCTISTNTSSHTGHNCSSISSSASEISSETIAPDHFHLIDPSCQIEDIQEVQRNKIPMDAFHDFLDSQTSEEIVLDQDYTSKLNRAVLSPYTVNRDMTLDLMGHTIEFAGLSQLFTVAPGVTLKIIDNGEPYNETTHETNPFAPPHPIPGAFNGETLTYYTTKSTGIVKGDSHAEVNTEEETQEHTLTVTEYGRLFSTSDNIRKADCLVRVDGGKFELERGILANQGGEHNILTMNGGTVTMTGGYLIGAASTGNGGGILAGSTSGDITISGGVIAANTAAENGGGIACTSPESERKIEISGNAVIAGNTAGNSGGGIFFRNPPENNKKAVSGTVNLSGGLVTNNITTNRGAIVGGGGIRCVNMEFTNGNITQNQTGGCGGGVFIGKNLLLTKGTIAGNTSAHVGGGIFIASDGGRAEINGVSNDEPVYITNNTANAVPGAHGFPGGGIFVEHPNDGDPDRQSHVTLTNVLITDNTAAFGGGIAGCGVSNVYDFAIEGAAIFDNHITSEDDSHKPGIDIAHDFNNKFQPGAGSVSRQMILDGDLATWSGTYTVFDQNNKHSIAQLKESDWGSEITKRFTHHFYLTAKVDESVKEKEKAAAKVIISGNSAPNGGGGGIGGNGHIQMGVERALVIEKKVLNGLDTDKFDFDIELTNIPESYECWYSIERKSQTVEPGSFNKQLKVTLSDGDKLYIYRLPKGIEVGYTVTESQGNSLSENFETSITVLGKQGTEETKSNVVSGTVDPTEVEKVTFVNKRLTSITVEKQWEDDNDKAQQRPTSIKVQLLRVPRNASDTAKAEAVPGSEATLKSDNGWKHTWNGLNSDYLYSVKEEEIPNYTALESGQNGGFITHGTLILTNVYQKNKLRVEKKWIGDSDNM